MITTRLGAEVLGLEELDGRAVDLDEAVALLGVAQRNGCLLAPKHLHGSLRCRLERRG